MLLRQTILVLVAIFAAAEVAAEHPKTDVVTTDDGSILYGEVLQLQYATLRLKTDVAGTLEIEWRRVTSIRSEFDYQVELTGADRHYGTLETSDKPMHVNIVGTDGSLEVALSEVVMLAPIEDGVFERIDGTVSAGLTYTQANEVLQYNVGLNAHYRDRRNYVTLSASSIFNDQKSGESTEQSDLKTVWSRVRKGKIGPFVLGSLSSNPTQGYDSRTILGGGLTRLFVENSAHLLAFNLGIVNNRESVTDSSEVDSSNELLTSVSFRRYKSSSDSPSISASADIFTDLGSGTRRNRANLDFILGWKLFHDFTLNFQVTNSYDSDPPGEGASKNNLVVVTSVAYTF